MTFEEIEALKADRDAQFKEVTRLLQIMLMAITDIRGGLYEDAFDTLCRGMGLDPEAEGIKDAKFRANLKKA